MVEWLRDHLPGLFWMTGISVAVLIAALLGGHTFLLKLPADYLKHRRRPPVRLAIGPIPASAVRVAKNVVGYVCIIAGLAMLVLPGPGIVVALVGFLMVDFPGKYPVEKWLLSRPRMLTLINWLRRRKGRPPLQPASSSKGARKRPNLVDGARG